MEMKEKQTRIPIAAILLTASIVLSNLLIPLLSILIFGHAVYSPNILMLLIEVAICCFLFMNRRDILLVAGIGALCLYYFFNVIRQLIRLFRYTFYFPLGIGWFIASALMLLLVIILGDQNLIKIRDTNIKEICSKLYFIPSALALGLTFLTFIFQIKSNHILLVVLANTIDDLLFVAFFFTLGAWLKEPFGKATIVFSHETAAKAAPTGVSTTSTPMNEAYCDLMKHILLCLFTFGIWYLIWIYKTTKHLNNAPNCEQQNPTSQLLLCMFIPFYQIYWFYKHGQKVDALSKHRGLNNSDIASLCLILGIFVPIVACIIMQDRINTICTAGGTPVAPVSTPVTPDAAPSAASASAPKDDDYTIEQLKKYKDLLDKGIITQEEFDIKKKQLLGL